MAKAKVVSVEEFQRFGEYKKGRLRFYGIDHYLIHGWQFYPDEYTATVVKSWRIMRKIMRIRARVMVRTASMNGCQGVILYRRSKMFGDASLINALAATKFMSETVTTL